MSDSLPTHVKVGVFDYRIESWNSKDANSSRRYGETDNDQKKIRIDESYSGRQTATTLLHEIQHAIWSLWTIESKYNEEDTIVRMTHGLATVWRDNPDLMQWIHERLVKPS